MDIYRKKQRWKQILFIAAVLIGVGSLWYTNRLVKQIEITERQKMELWAEAVRIMDQADFDTDLAFPFSVIESNTHIPVILTDSSGNILSHKNLDSIKSEDPAYLQRQLEHARLENDSLVINLGPDEKQYLHYRDSILAAHTDFLSHMFNWG